MAAEDIKAILSGREKIEQERIMRWVGESLGVAAAPSASAVTPPPSAALSSASAPAAAAPAQPAGKMDIKTFVTSKMPKSDNQAAAVIAYYFRFEAPVAERKETITPEELQNASRQARGGSVFKNPLSTLNNAMAQGYFDRRERGVFGLNAVGENLVAMALPGSGGNNGGKARRKASRPKPSAAKKAKKA